jgi:hypothetical protein
MKNDSFLTRHLHEAGEGYFEHLGFTIKASARLIGGGLAVLTHGLLPWCFTHTGSAIVNDMHAELKRRREACEESRRPPDDHSI